MKQHIRSFLRALVRHLPDAYGAERDRVFAIGYSSGGQLAYRVALEAPELLRGIAVFSANLPAPDALDCGEAGSPMPTMIVNGTADPINPFAGGDVVLPDGTHLGRVRSAEQSLAYFGALAGHRGEPTRERVVGAERTGGAMWIERSGWSVPGRVDMVLYTVHNGGHTIPSAAAAFPASLGPVERRVDAVAEALRFFGLR